MTPIASSSPKEAVQEKARDPSEQPSQKRSRGRRTAKQESQSPKDDLARVIALEKPQSHPPATQEANRAAQTSELTAGKALLQLFELIHHQQKSLLRWLGVENYQTGGQVRKTKRPRKGGILDQKV